MMPLLAELNSEEQKALIHMLCSESQDGQILSAKIDNIIETKLAKISEKENYEIKNRYRHQNKTMNFAEKKRMPIDESKVKDLLRHQHIFRNRLNSEVRTYQRLIDNPQMEHGVLTYLSEAAYGDMKDLIRDVGIKKDNIPFYNLASHNAMNKANMQY